MNAAKVARSRLQDFLVVFHDLTCPVDVDLDSIVIEAFGKRLKGLLERFEIEIENSNECHGRTRSVI
jgi:hypothetical protein